MVHVGVDLDKRSSQIAVLSEDGEIVQHRLANDAARLEKFFAHLPPHTPIAIEASGTWWWLVDLLEELGHQPVLSNPKQTKAIAAARLKNDRVDAERLALLLLADIRKRGNLNRPAERHGQADALEGRRVASATRRR